jgi:transposase-like protein
MQSSEKKRRRRHSAVFKAEAVAACREPGASTAGVALDRQVNANLLRRWVKEAAGKTAVAMTPSRGPAFLPVAVTAQGRTARSERPIRVQVRRRGLRVTIQWPTTAAEHCAAWLKELLG